MRQQVADSTHRKQHLNGVNFGGWLVLEKWITPSLFKDSPSPDEYSLSSEDRARHKLIEKHHHTFIQESDFKWLHTLQINAIRIPIGWWIYGDESPYVKSIDRLDWAFRMAKKYNMSLLLSIHGAPGSQNGKIHSGKIGNIQWHTHQKELSKFTKKIVYRYKDHPSFWGIELLNEPTSDVMHIFHLMRYYVPMLRWIKQKSPSLKVVISDGFRPLLWALFCRVTKSVLDLHPYHGFGSSSHHTTLKSLRQYKKRLRIISKISLNIVGEWAAVSARDTPIKDLGDYFDLQKELYDLTTHGNFFWTYKTEGGGSWDYQHMSHADKKNNTSNLDILRT